MIEAVRQLIGRARILILSGLVLCFGCHNLPNNGVPIYLHIDSPTVVSAYPLGSDSNYIPDVWVTSGSENIGAFEMPATIPVLAGGNVSFAISAGIWDNGTVAAPVQYPFFRPDTFTILNAVPGHAYHHKPVYHYFAYTLNALNADFETTNLFTNLSRWTDRQENNVFEGAGSGAILLPASDSFIKAYQTIPVPVITNGRPAYVEINYKISNPNMLMEVGLTATNYSGGSASATDYSNVYLQGKDNLWRKAYLNFSNEIGTANAQSNNQTYFQVYLKAYHDGKQPDTVFVDNVKLLYFQ